MAKDSDPLADAFGAKETGGLFSGLVAEESSFDRGMMWRLGSWGVAAGGAVVLAVFANQAPLGWRGGPVASPRFPRQGDPPPIPAQGGPKQGPPPPPPARE